MKERKKKPKALCDYLSEGSFCAKTVPLRGGYSSMNPACNGGFVLELRGMI